MQKSAIWIVSSVFTFLQICQCVWSKYNIHCCEKLQLAGGRLSSLLPLKTFGFCDSVTVIGEPDCHQICRLFSHFQQPGWCRPLWASEPNEAESNQKCQDLCVERRHTQGLWRIHEKKKNLPVTYLQVCTTATRLLAYVWHLCHMHEFVSFCSRTAGSSHSL